MEVYHGKEEKGNKENIRIIKEYEQLEIIANEGLLALSVELGLTVMKQMFEADVIALAGEKGKHNPSREAYRHGKNEKTSVVLGGAKLSVERPRVRSKGGTELPLASLELFQRSDPLTKAVLRRVLQGVSMRAYGNTLDYGDEELVCVSKSEASRRFIRGMEGEMEAFLTRRLDEDYVAVFIDGLQVDGWTVVAALGILNTGHKKVLGLIDGATENSTVCKSLLLNLVDRGLDPAVRRLYIIDGSKALSKAIKDIFGTPVPVQRCQVHKKRNVLDHLPESERANISRQMTLAYREFEGDIAMNKLNLLADNLEHRYPSAAASLREGMEETLTVHRLKVPGLLRMTLCSTNCIESANSVARQTIGRVKNWKNGTQVIRWLTAGFLQAEKGFIRIKGYRQIPFLINAIRGDEMFQTESCAQVS
jgi:putative transposase